MLFFCFVTQTASVAYVAYDEIMNFSQKIVASNFNIDPTSVDAIMKNDFNKIRAAEFVFESPSLARVIQLEQLVRNSKNEKQSLPQKEPVEVNAPTIKYFQ